MGENVVEFSKVKSIEEDGIEDVYCATVPQVGNFVANDIVIKNCDSLRYVIYTHYGQRENLKEKTLEERRQEAYQREYMKNPMQYPGWGAGWQKF